MENLIKACLVRNLDEGNLPLVFKRKAESKEYSADCELTEFGKELIHTTVCIASKERNDDTVVTAEGHINRVNEYESWSGNLAKVQNFSDRVALDELALKARRYVVKSNCSLTYDKEYVVSPLVHKDNIEMLGKKSKAKRTFETSKVDKAGLTIGSLPFIFKDADNFYQFGESNDNSVAKELVWLRKVSFKINGMDDYLTTIPNWADEEEYVIWASEGMLKK